MTGQADTIALPRTEAATLAELLHTLETVLDIDDVTIAYALDEHSGQAGGMWTGTVGFLGRAARISVVQRAAAARPRTTVSIRRSGTWLRAIVVGGAAGLSPRSMVRERASSAVRSRCSAASCCGGVPVIGRLSGGHHPVPGRGGRLGGGGACSSRDLQVLGESVQGAADLTVPRVRPRVSAIWASLRFAQYRRTSTSRWRRVSRLRASRTSR